MATGDTNDMVNRLRAVFPNWFSDPSVSKFANAVFAGLATGLSFAYSAIQYAKLQTRIQTATGGWLDLIAWDFFNVGFLRRRAESDDSFRSRVLKEVLRPRLTKAAILQMLLDLTGRQGIVIELNDASAIGSWDGPAFGFDTYGGYGSTENNGLIIVAQRPINSGLPILSGYDSDAGGWDTNMFGLLDQSDLVGPLSDADITAQILRTIAAGINPTIIITG
jgi:hypothetical protein